MQGIAPVPVGQWARIAVEGQAFTVSGTQVVRYGVDTALRATGSAGATHTISTPVANATYTATYTDIGPVTNTPPTVALAAPANNSSGTVGVAIALNANAADSDGMVAGVEFFENGVQIGATDARSPYSVTVDSNLYASGQHVNRARARDAAGNLSLCVGCCNRAVRWRTHPAGGLHAQ